MTWDRSHSKGNWPPKNLLYGVRMPSGGFEPSRCLLVRHTYMVQLHITYILHAIIWDVRSYHDKLVPRATLAQNPPEQLEFQRQLHEKLALKG